MAAVIAITVTVIIAQCSKLTSMITPANRSAAVIIVNRRRDHEFVIIASVFSIYQVRITTDRAICTGPLNWLLENVTYPHD